MRTRNADAAKSGATRKSPQAKKDAGANSEAAPELTPKPGIKTTRASGRQSARRAAASTAVTVTPDPNPELQDTAEELATPSEMKSAAAITKKSASGKEKTPPGQKAAAATPSSIEEVVEELAGKIEAEEYKREVEPNEQTNEVALEEPNNELVTSDVKSTGDITSTKNGEASADAGQQMEDDIDPEEPAEEEVAVEEDVGGAAVEEAEKGEDEREDAIVGVEDEEGLQVEEDEQMEISDMAKRRLMKKEQEIFVGGLDRDAVEEDLKMAFEKVGEVVEVRLHKDFLTNKNKGFAFVKFSNKEQATRALSELKNPIIRGKRCGIAPSEDNDTLFLGNICNTWTKEAIKQKLKDYGVEGVEHITLVLDTQSEGLSRGFAFLEFSCHEEAMLAYKRLQKPDAIFGHPERTAKVAFAEPLREPDPEVMAQVKSVFVDGLPPFWDEDQVKEQFKGYGEIERVVLARNMSTAKRKDFGFVNFATHEAAVACVEGINDTELGDGKFKMKVRARLANPLPKTQAVKGGMSGGYRIGYTGVGVYSRFGRGFGRGRFPSFRAGFQGGRSFNFRGHGRGGRFPFPHDGGMEGSSSTGFHFRRPFGGRGGRGFPMSGRHGAFRGRGQIFPSRRPPFPPEEEFGRPFGVRYGEDPYFYGDVRHGHGMKRPFSMMDHDSGYMEPGNRLRPRYDHPDMMPRGSHYGESMGMGGLRSHDYYGPDYGGNAYSSYGGPRSGGGYYY